MSLPRYAEYKDSGVAWLGEVPAHWSVERFKWNIERNDGGVWGDEPDGIDDTAVLRSTEQTVDGNWKMVDPAYRKLSADERAAALLESGDLLLTKSSGSSLHIGKTTLVNDEIANLGCCYSNFMQRLRTNKRIAPEVAWYFLNNELSRLQFDLLSNSTTGLANLNGSMIGELMVAVAPREEQSAITVFLDRETGKIDALIAEQEKLLTLLAEKRQATISHAVTRGLNPNAPMKDSGVPWLGDVPAHWDVCPLKYISRIGNGSTPNRDNPGYWNESGFPWLNSSVVNQDEVTEAERFVTELALKECHLPVVQPPAVLVGITGQGKTRGMAAPLLFEATINQHLAYIKPERGRLQVAYLLRAMEMAYEHLRVDSEGAGSTKGAITCDQLSRFAIPLPPLDEQDAIASHLDVKAAQFDRLASDSRQTITLLKERRSALIAAAVTGKIDVRQAA